MLISPLNAGAMTHTEASPFESCKFDDDPLPPLPEDSSITTGVASMIDSPFASGMIAPGLMEQLSQSITAGSSKGVDASHSGGAGHTVAVARAGSDAAGGAVDVTTAAKPSTGRLQGVASILESPFASSCLSHDMKQLDLQQGPEKVSDAAA